MLPEGLSWIVEGFEPEGDPWQMLQVARDLEREGNLAGAATVLDRAFGIAPEVGQIREGRRSVLDRLAVREHGLVFRYVPGGPFLMGRADGEPDERPLHPVWLAPFWVADAPMNWEDYCRLHGWLPPPEGLPAAGGDERWSLYHANRLCHQYSGVVVTEADGAEAIRASRQSRWEGDQERTRYDLKPVVGVAWQEAEELARKISTKKVRYSLPTEAQWEKAARGGLIGARHPWGDESPSEDNCDFDRFHAFQIRPTKELPPNGYGLYAMAGGVWEWTADWYDSGYYRDAPSHDPRGPAEGQEKVLRGGSWADCAEAVTNSFRMSRSSRGWQDQEGEVGQMTPTIGFRLCRVVTGG